MKDERQMWRRRTDIGGTDRKTQERQSWEEERQWVGEGGGKGGEGRRL